MKPIVPIIICLLAAACSSDPQEPGQRPGSIPGTPDRPGQAEDTALAAALADASQRVVTPDVTFLYDSGGIIFGSTDAGSLYCVDVTDGSRIDFNPKAETLSVNGKNVCVKSAELVRRTDATSWWVINLTEPSGARVIFVTDF